MAVRGRRERTAVAGKSRRRAFRRRLYRRRALAVLFAAACILFLLAMVFCGLASLAAALAAAFAF